MSIGFGNDNETEEASSEIEHRALDTVRWQPWNSLVVGMKVKSVLTGTVGQIAALHEQWKVVEINWDNGKQSRANKDALTKVIVI